MCLTRLSGQVHRHVREIENQARVLEMRQPLLVILGLADDIRTHESFYARLTPAATIARAQSAQGNSDEYIVAPLREIFLSRASLIELRSACSNTKYFHAGSFTIAL
jgi:hypothetical protein